MNDRAEKRVCVCMCVYTLLTTGRLHSLTSER